MTNILLAKQDGTPLVTHTKQVMDMAMEIGKKIVSPEKFEEIKADISLVAILHDIGKCAPSFQEELKGKKKKKKDFKHNSISAAFSFCRINNLNKNRYDILSPVLYHHHVKDDGETKLLDIVKHVSKSKYTDEMRLFYNKMVMYAMEKYGIDLTPFYFISDERDFNGSDENRLKGIPLYVPLLDDKKVSLDDFERAANISLLRSILIHADRMVSMSSTSPIDEITTELLSPDYSKYDAVRLQKQCEIVNDIYTSDCRTHILEASAGSGKTLMGIMWHLKRRKKTLWVVPRNVIGYGTYESIVSELKSMGLNNSVKVGLYMTNRMVKTNFAQAEECSTNQCDILVINIDSLLSFYSRNNKAIYIVDWYTKDIIVDEYHEIVSTDPMFAAIAQILFARIHHTATETLLMSATAIPIEVHILHCDEHQVQRHVLEGYGGEIKINVQITITPDSVPYLPNTFLITYSVKKAQNYYRSMEGNKFLIHSRYLPKDREEKENKLYEFFGKTAIHGTNKPMVVGTSIIGTGLDISAERIVEEIVTPEDTIQRGYGRGGRYNEYNEIKYIGMVSDSMRCPKKEFSSKIYELWVQKLMQYNNQAITKNELMGIYKDFYNTPEVIKLYRAYLANSLKESWKNLTQIKTKTGNNIDDDSTVVLSPDMTYRGSNTTLFVTAYDDNVPNTTIEPIAVEEYILEDEDEFDFENNIKRYEFLTKKCDKNKYQSKSIGILKPKQASAKKCSQLAYTNQCPVFLTNHRYNNELGLYLSTTAE